MKATTLTDDLRWRLRSYVGGGVSVYRVSKETGIHPSVLGRFLAEPGKRLDSQTIDALAKFLGLELAAIGAKVARRSRSAGRQSARK